MALEPFSNKICPLTIGCPAVAAGVPGGGVPGSLSLPTRGGWGAGGGGAGRCGGRGARRSVTRVAAQIHVGLQPTVKRCASRGLVAVLTTCAEDKIMRTAGSR